MVQSNGKHLEGTYVTFLSLRATIHLKKNQQPHYFGRTKIHH